VTKLAEQTEPVLFQNILPPLHLTRQPENCAKYIYDSVAVSKWVTKKKQTSTGRGV